MRRAQKIVETCVVQGMRMIDRHLGDGYAKDHPELLAAVIRAAASDLNFARLTRGIGD
jgi:hypothetical protein